MTNPNDSIHNSEQGTQDGLTKREYFAAMAMVGNLSMVQRWPTDGHNKIAKLSVQQADALIKALNDANP